MRYTPKDVVRFGSRTRQERLRTVVVITSPGTLPATFSQDVEYAYPWTNVEEVHSLAAALRVFNHTVSLIVVHSGLLDDLEKRAAELFQFHPLAMSVVLTPTEQVSMEIWNRCLASSVVRGILPLTGRAEVCSSIVGLFLQRIEYFPRPAWSPALEHAPEPRGQESGGAQTGSSRLDTLTKRELQILGLVQQGFRNKSIANDLHLSDHTVKIHLHNIIHKLGASNRTEAAAMYRRAEGSAGLH